MLTSSWIAPFRNRSVAFAFLALMWRIFSSIMLVIIFFQSNSSAIEINKSNGNPKVSGKNIQIDGPYTDGASTYLCVGGINQTTKIINLDAWKLFASGRFDACSVPHNFVPRKDVIVKSYESCGVATDLCGYRLGNFGEIYEVIEDTTARCARNMNAFYEIRFNSGDIYQFYIVQRLSRPRDAVLDVFCEAAQGKEIRVTQDYDVVGLLACITLSGDRTLLVSSGERELAKPFAILIKNVDDFQNVRSRISKLSDDVILIPRSLISEELRSAGGDIRERYSVFERAIKEEKARADRPQLLPLSP